MALRDPPWIWPNCCVWLKHSGFFYHLLLNEKFFNCFLSYFSQFLVYKILSQFAASLCLHFLSIAKKKNLENGYTFTTVKLRMNILPHVQFQCLVRPSFPTCMVPVKIFELSVPLLPHVQFQPNMHYPFLAHVRSKLQLIKNQWPKNIEYSQDMD